MPVFVNILLMIFLLLYGLGNCYPDNPPIASMTMWFLAGMVAWHLIVSSGLSISVST